MQNSGKAVFYPSAYYGEGTGKIWLDDVQCDDTAESILQCSHLPFGENNCYHSEDVSLVCGGE